MPSMLSGWSLYPRFETRIINPQDISSLQAMLRAEPETSVIARGLGRSYGDAAVNPSGNTVLTERLKHQMELDSATGVLRCEAGLSYRNLMDMLLPQGWFLPVVPGTAHVTVGGSIASDIHGINHHQVGSLFNAVHQLKLLTASGEEAVCSNTRNAELFQATVGGMGLTGIITQADVKLQPVETAYILGSTIQTHNLEDTVDVLQRYDRRYPYSVAQLDILARESDLGMGQVIGGRHALVSESTHDNNRKNPLKSSPPLHLPALPALLLSPRRVLWMKKIYGMGLLKNKGETPFVMPLQNFFFRMDQFPSWNRIYGKSGFAQYHCVVQDIDILRQIIQRFQQSGLVSVFATLKCLGAESEGYLSFPKPGYMLAFDLPQTPHTNALLAQLDAMVVSASGRVYLGKDYWLSPETFRHMYPRYPQWKRVKQEIDPKNKFSSHLSQRLEL